MTAPLSIPGVDGMSVSRGCAPLVFLLVLGACASPVSHTNTSLSTYDKDTEYGLEERFDGFGLTVYYSRYQFFPESDAVATACKNQLTAIAWEHSDRVGRKIKPSERATHSDLNGPN